MADNLIYPVLAGLLLIIIPAVIKLIGMWLKNNVTKPIKYMDCRFEIIIDYMKEESGNGFSDFYDKSLKRKLEEKNLKEKV
jgi:hypothetical protein